jgi:CheY-like chemotaxis protein
MGDPFRVLWIDDDGPERFEYEECVIKEELNQDVVWADTARVALDKLRQERFDAILLDQMIRLAEYEEPDVWGGCRILRWLRGASQSKVAPLAGVDETWGAPALEANRRVPVLVVSAFFDPDVLGEMRSASEIDWDLRASPKPIRLEEIQLFLTRSRSGG